DNLRLLTVKRHGAPEPLSEAALDHIWTPCDPRTVAGFSAVGYYFGRDIQKSRNVPVGLISSNVGGTPAERWMSKEALAAVPGGAPKDLKQVNDLYNAMIAPLAPYAIRGVIWYQGEANVPRAAQYQDMLSAMIKNWRDTFNQGNFPFLLV